MVKVLSGAKVRLRKKRVYPGGSYMGLPQFRPKLTGNTCAHCQTPVRAPGFRRTPESTREFCTFDCLQAWWIEWARGFTMHWSLQEWFHIDIRHICARCGRRIRGQIFEVQGDEAEYCSDECVKFRGTVPEQAELDFRPVPKSLQDIVDLARSDERVRVDSRGVPIVKMVLPAWFDRPRCHSCGLPFSKKECEQKGLDSSPARNGRAL